LSGALLRDLGAKFWDEKDWKLEVTDELGQTLFILTFSVEERTTMFNRRDRVPNAGERLGIVGGGPSPKALSPGFGK